MSSDVTDLKKSNTDSESSDDSGFLYDSQDSDRTFSQTSASMNTTVSVWWCRCGIHRIKIINQSHRFSYSGCIRFTVQIQQHQQSARFRICKPFHRIFTSDAGINPRYSAADGRICRIAWHFIGYCSVRVCTARCFGCVRHLYRRLSRGKLPAKKHRPSLIE